MKTVYVSGPMRGITDFNYPEFDSASKLFRDQGYFVISPADLDRERKEPATMYQILVQDVEAILSLSKENGDFLYMLRGWDESVGARAEYYLAYWMGLEIVFQDGAYLPDTDTEKNVLQEALDATGRSRPGQYGHPIDHFQTTVDLVNARFGTRFTPKDWGVIMMLDKVARHKKNGNRDSLVDIAGYARTIEMIDEETKKRLTKQ